MKRIITYVGLIASILASGSSTSMGAQSGKGTPLEDPTRKKYYTENYNIAPSANDINNAITTNLKTHRDNAIRSIALSSSTPGTSTPTSTVDQENYLKALTLKVRTNYNFPKSFKQNCLFSDTDSIEILKLSDLDGDWWHKVDGAKFWHLDARGNQLPPPDLNITTANSNSSMGAITQDTIMKAYSTRISGQIGMLECRIDEYCYTLLGLIGLNKAGHAVITPWSAATSEDWRKKYGPGIPAATKPIHEAIVPIINKRGFNTTGLDAMLLQLSNSGTELHIFDRLCEGLAKGRSVLVVNPAKANLSVRIAKKAGTTTGLDISKQVVRIIDTLLAMDHNKNLLEAIKNKFDQELNHNTGTGFDALPSNTDFH